MNKVTELKKLKNNTYLLTITVKNKTKTHVVSEETIIAFNLLSSSELSDSEYKKMVGQNDDFLLYEKAVHFIDYQMRSISEVKKHLKKSMIYVDINPRYFGSTRDLTQKIDVPAKSAT